MTNPSGNQITLSGWQSTLVVGLLVTLTAGFIYYNLGLRDNVTKLIQNQQQIARTNDRLETGIDQLRNKYYALESRVAVVESRQDRSRPSDAVWRVAPDGSQRSNLLVVKR